jgi:hypothetical protein
MVAKPFGFEEILAKELQMLCTRREQGVRMSFKGIKDLCTNLSLRTAF